MKSEASMNWDKALPHCSWCFLLDIKHLPKACFVGTSQAVAKRCRQNPLSLCLTQVPHPGHRHLGTCEHDSLRDWNLTAWRFSIIKTASFSLRTCSKFCNNYLALKSWSQKGRIHNILYRWKHPRCYSDKNNLIVVTVNYRNLRLKITGTGN